MDRSISAPQKVANTISEWVWYDGDGALLQGQGVCYEFDYYAPVTAAGTAAETGVEADARRTNRVVLPNRANNRWFAGVLAADHAANTGGQLVEIYVPGSTCKILAKAAVTLTLGVGTITCQAGGALAGYFTRTGFDGSGTAVPLQTLAITAGVKILARLQEGGQSGLVEVLDPNDADASYKTAGTTATPPQGTTTLGGARQAMVGGVSYYAVNTQNTAIITSTLANGTRVGEKKGVVIDGTQAHYGVTTTVSSGVQANGTTALQSFSSLVSGHCCYLEWGGVVWTTKSNNFTTLT